MKFFSRLKNIFNKPISLLPIQKNDLVVFVRLKNNMVRLNCDAIVEEDYNLVFVHYNRVCDVLQPGTHTIKDVTIPKLFKYAKVYRNRKGIFVPRTVVTDAYFVSLKEFSYNKFKTTGRVVSMKDDEKIKIKLEGTFSLKVIDAEMFMKALCSDYAIIKNKKTLKEICSTVGFEVANALNRKIFSLNDYIYNKEKIIQEIQDKINNHTKTFGVETFNFLITNVIYPKKFLSGIELGKSSNEQFKTVSQNEDIIKLVEDRLNGLKKDLDVVYVNEKGENSISNQNFESEVIIKDNKNSIQENKENTINNVSQIEKEPSLIIEIPSTENMQKEPSIINEEKKEEIVVNEELIDDLIEKIDKRKKQKKNNRIVEIFENAGIVEKEDKKVSKKLKKCSYCGESLDDSSKYCNKCGKSTEELKICPCCGAKNFPNATTCCVCKSQL